MSAWSFSRAFPARELREMKCLLGGIFWARSAHLLKTRVRESGPRVRIPPPPSSGRLRTAIRVVGLIRKLWEGRAWRSMASRM
jgi:hypothetical protein